MSRMSSAGIESERSQRNLSTSDGGAATSPAFSGTGIENDRLAVNEIERFSRNELSSGTRLKSLHKSPAPRSVANTAADGKEKNHGGAAPNRRPSVLRNSNSVNPSILNSNSAMKPSDIGGAGISSANSANVSAKIPTDVLESSEKTNSSSIATLKKDGEPSSEIGTVVSKMWQNMKKMMGFSPDCKNGGHKNLRGDCVCQKNYRGDYCEQIVCLNNGTVKTGPAVLDPLTTTQFCECPHPDFISGRHCEVVRCHNGGRDLGNGYCACVDGWYTGQFCQYYTSSWLFAIGLPVLGVAFLIMCCVICRLDLCPRPRSTRHTQRSRRYYTTAGNSSSFQQPPPRSQAQNHFAHHHQSQQRQHLLSSGGVDGRLFADRNASLALFNQEISAREQALLIQQNLLNESMVRNGIGGHSSIPQGYVVRLEHIPVYNPRLFHQSDSTGSGFTPQHQSGFKIEPPPSYDQAVLRCPSLSSNVLPPNYSPPHSGVDDTGAIEDGGQSPYSNNFGQPPPPPNRAPPRPPMS